MQLKTIADSLWDLDQAMFCQLFCENFLIFLQDKRFFSAGLKHIHFTLKEQE